MKLPVKELNILGKKCKVIQEKTVHNPITGEVIEGHFDPRSFDITITEKKDRDDMMATLLHEISHAVVLRSGLFQTHVEWDIWEMVAEVHSNVIVENFTLTPKKKTPRKS